MIKEIKVGDTVVIRGVVQHVVGNDMLYIKTPGYELHGNFSCHINRIEEVIPAPVIPKAGEVWRKINHPHQKRHIIYADDTGVYYERLGPGLNDQGRRDHLSHISFINHFELDTE